LINDSALYVQHPKCITASFQLCGYICQYSFTIGILSEGLTKRDEVGQVEMLQCVLITTASPPEFMQIERRSRSVPCDCRIFSSHSHFPCSLWQSSKANFFPPFSCLCLKLDTPCATGDQFGPQNFVLALTFWFMFRVCVRSTRYWVNISSVDDFWRVCLLGVLWETPGPNWGLSREWSFPPYLLCVWLLASEYLVVYLYNKSLIIEQQFTIDGLFDYVYCVYISLESRFHNGRREPKYGNSGAGCKTHKWTWSTDYYWEGSIKILGIKLVTVSICLPQISDAVSCVWTH
jgi:hypothetical protein